MSLEQSLDRTNQLLETIISILQTGVSAPSELGLAAPTVTAVAEAAAEVAAPKKRGRPAKNAEVAEAAPAPAAEFDPTALPADERGPGVVDGGNETQYFVVERHRSAYKIEPGEVNPQVSGSCRVTREVYEAKKAEFAKNVVTPETGSPAAPTTAPAATPAPSTPAASPASLPTSEQPSADVPFAKIIERITALNKSPEPGHGREGVLAVLRKWLPGDDKPTVTKLQPLGKNAEILADIEDMLTPASESAEDDFDPLA